MTFRATKKRYLILAGVLLALLSFLGKQGFSQDFWAQAGILLLIFGILLLWLASFELRIDGELTVCRSLFGGKVRFNTEDIKSIKINKYDELTHLLYSKHTLFIDLKSGRQVKLNTSVFPVEVADLLARRGWPVRK